MSRVNFDGDEFCDVKKSFEFRQLSKRWCLRVAVACEVRCSIKCVTRSRFQVRSYEVGTSIENRSLECCLACSWLKHMATSHIHETWFAYNTRLPKTCHHAVINRTPLWPDPIHFHRPWLVTCALLGCTKGLSGPLAVYSQLWVCYTIYFSSNNCEAGIPHGEGVKPISSKIQSIETVLATLW